MRFFVFGACACALSGCAGEGGSLHSGAAVEPLALKAAAEQGAPVRPALDPNTALRNFREAVARAKPAAEAYCRERKASDADFLCDVRVMVDTRVDVQPNAFQTFDDSGRPVIMFNVPFIATARNQAEIAFVLGHEMGHLLGGDVEKLRAAGERAALPDRQGLELEADRVGARIALEAGYDPVLGARVLALHGSAGSGGTGGSHRTHPDGAERIAAVTAAARLPE